MTNKPGKVKTLVPLISFYLFSLFIVGCTGLISLPNSVAYSCADDDLQLDKSYSAANPNNTFQIKRCAEQGNAQMQYIYGDTFYNSEHKNDEMQQAVYWWTKAGKQGHGDAWYRLGQLYEQGYDYSIEGRADIAKSVAYYQLGASAGSNYAQYYLGVALYRGWGILQNQKAARQWWKKAAGNGYQSAHDAYTGTVAVKWYPEIDSPIWQLYNRVNNKSRAQVFTMLTEMIPYENDAEFRLVEQKYPEPQYHQMYLDMYQVLKYLPTKLSDMPTCVEFKMILTEEFSNELNSHFNSNIYAELVESQINSALWYALQRVCVPQKINNTN